MQPPRPPTVFDIFPSVEQTKIVPTENDVLCGKDKTFSQHSGNRRYKQLIDSQGISYAKATTKQMKMDITKYIVDTMRHSGSRFLEPNGVGNWNELSDSKARDKISHALRFFVKQQNQTKTGSEETSLQQEPGPSSVSSTVVPPHCPVAATVTVPPVVPSTGLSHAPASRPQHPAPAPSHPNYHVELSQQHPPTQSISSTFSISSLNHHHQHPLGILGEAARFILSTTTPTSSINNRTTNSETIRSMEYDAMNTLQSYELRDLIQKMQEDEHLTMDGDDDDDQMEE